MDRKIDILAPLAMIALAACAVGGQGQSTDAAARRAGSSGAYMNYNSGGTAATRSDQGADPGIGGAPLNPGAASGGGN
jgi:hypothetical protein